MNKITVTQKGVQLQQELKENLGNVITPRIVLEKQESPKGYRLLLNLSQDNLKDSIKLQNTNRSNMSTFRTTKTTRASSLQTTRSCFTEEANAHSPRVREMRNQSLLSRIKAKERKIEYSVKQNLCNYTNPNEMNSILNRINMSTLSTKNILTSSQMVIEQQKQNLIENMQRQQERIYKKYVLNTNKQELLQSKQQEKYQQQMIQKQQVIVEDKARDKFWQNWQSMQSVLKQRTAQFNIDKERGMERLEQFCKHRYLKSFLNLPKCAKNYDKNYEEYKQL
ncbi:hypothetical protein TTHERM_00128690 (macronuclear) [Tetrahymena thermophila SB210]|uniref:Uncharacterized protein n=1 Tax=Tetrahymena thermophila (strain SB210) TaxID=312017 RepID=I7LUV2_TETTS|nr:hypothetical protein TTHERM_00128690 [Tetrahymena thermophila SB210]EAR96105.1 hypothetical protein TTHERM_00128690 [Tetrahymena thermophila SB210]|eukprot:XP_001016350.1 hypothetical protein TTHERM_00128690 [Tetrahymena thermophila SB210]